MLILLLTVAMTCTPIRTCKPNAIPPITTDCATPTPVLSWDPLDDPVLAGYELWMREDGEPFVLASWLPCIWWDSDPTDANTTLDMRGCRGGDFPISAQVACPTCQPYQLYEFCVKARNLVGLSSLTCSNMVTICFSPIWRAGISYEYE